MILPSRWHFLLPGTLAFSQLCIGVDIYTTFLPENIIAINDVAPRAHRQTLMPGWDIDPETGRYSVIVNSRLRLPAKGASEIQASDMFPIYVNYKEPEKSWFSAGSRVNLNLSPESSVFPYKAYKALLDANKIWLTGSSHGHAYGYRLANGSPNGVYQDHNGKSLANVPLLQGNTSFVEWVTTTASGNEQLMISNARDSYLDPSDIPFEAGVYDTNTNKLTRMKLQQAQANKRLNYLSTVPDTHNQTLSTWQFSEGDIQFPDTNWRYSCSNINGQCDQGTANRYDMTCQGGALFNHENVTLATSKEKIELLYGHQVKEIISPSYNLTNIQVYKLNFWINGEQCQGAHLVGGNCLLSFKKDLSDVACLFDFTLKDFLKEHNIIIGDSATLIFGHTLKTDSGLFLVPILYDDGNQHQFRVSVIELKEDEYDELLSRAFPRA